jgi:TnpA family transposase
MPRIRSIHDLTFFRPEAGKRYKHLDPLFGESVDWDLIARHFRDMLRVAVSIRLGKILPSTVLRRLGTYSRKNKLYFAFRELGRAVRTEFLLEYVDSIEVRRMVQKGANRSESMNDFLQWALFGNKGVIEENLRHEQRKIIKYNHLVANLVILHNVVAMSQALRDLIREGKVIEPEALAGLSPLRTSHINRLGIYSMDLSRISPSITNTHGILRSQ